MNRIFAISLLITYVVISASGCSGSAIPSQGEESGNTLKITLSGDLGDTIVGYEFIDQKGNEVTFFLPEEYGIDQVSVTENVTLGAHPEYTITTNNFIEIQYPVSEKGRQLVRVKTTGVFDYVFVYDPVEDVLHRESYSNLNNDVIEFRPVIRNGKVVFALVSGV